MNIAHQLKFALAPALLLSLAVPAFAGVTVNSPANNTSVGTTFTLSASAANCAGSNVVTMGYSFDSSTSTTVFKGQTINRSISSSTGAHTLHVKAWAPNGISCVKDSVIHVSGTSSNSAASEVPDSAETVSHIQALSGWQDTHDEGGPGWSSGSSSIVSSPSLYGSTRRFVTKFSGNGDHRYSVVFNDDPNAEHFFYDTWVYLDGSSSHLANLEFDVNQTMANGNTALIGFQCDGWTGNWAYNANVGTTKSPKPKWMSKSGTSCNPRSWSQKAWHHVQASFSRDSNGKVYYKSIWLDGKETKMNVSAYTGADLGWGPAINTQFQVDGLGNGTVTAYVDNLTISTW